MKTFLVFILVFVSVNLFAQNKEKAFDLGVFGMLSLPELDLGSPKAVRAAMMPLVELLQKERNEKIRIVTTNSSKEMHRLMQEKKVDCLFSNYREYYNLRKANLVIPVITNSIVSGSAFDRAVILTNKKINSIKETKNMHFGYLHKTAIYSFLYVDYKLRKLNSSIEKHFAKTTKYKDQKAAVFALFFNKINVTAISKSSWDIYKELYPQFVKKIHVIQTSRKIVNLPIFCRKEFPKYRRDRLVKTLLEMSKYTVGLEIMTIFKFKKFEKWSPEYDKLYENIKVFFE